LKNNTFSEWLDELKSKTDIVNIVSKYVPLQQKGRNLWGLCPFHHEKTPSFSINPDGQFYHCFGCGVSGDVISFVKEIEGLDFIDTVRMLGEKVNMQLPDIKGDDNFRDKEKKDKLLQMMKDAANHYHLNLQLKQAEEANKYIAKRGLDAETVKKFGIGYSLGYSDIIDYLSGKGYSHEMMFEAGLAEKKDGRYYDTLFNRLIFPICDMFGQVVAFGGRLLETKDFAKYKNTKETQLFVKNRTLYGMHLVKKLKLTEKVDNIIIVEGYIDTIAVSTAGFKNVVASMGTSLTKEQVKVIKRQVDKVYISYDGDGAGQKATIRGLDLLKNEGLDVMVVTLPEGLDPDDTIKQLGADGYKKLLDSALPLTEYKLKTLEKYFDLESYSGREKYATEAIRVLKESFNNNIEIEAYLESISKVTKISVDTLKFSLKMNEKGEKKVDYETKLTGSAYEIAEKYILHSMLYGKEYIKNFKDLDMLFEDKLNLRIYSYIKECREKDIKPQPSTLLNIMKEDENNKVMEIIDFESPPLKEDEEKYFTDCMKTLRRRYCDRKSRELSRMYDETDDNEKKKNIIEELKSIKQMMKS